MIFLNLYQPEKITIIIYVTKATEEVFVTLYNTEKIN